MRGELERLIDAVATLTQDRTAVTGPASSEALASLLKRYPDLPAEVLDFYRVTDGGLLSDPWWEFASIAGVLANADMLDAMIGADFADWVGWWSKDWIPVGVDVSGNALCVDTGGAVGELRGQVLIFMHDEERRRIIAPSFGDYIRCLRIATEADVVRYDPEDGFCLEGNQERWEAFLSGQNPGYPIERRATTAAS